MSELDLHVEIETADGNLYRWGHDEPDAHNAFSNLTFSTKRMDGFASLSCQLRRRVDVEWPDIALYDRVVVRSAGGDVAWEGRVSANPRQLDADGHSHQIEATGYMANARDRKFTQIYVDRDLGNWGEPTLERKQYLSDAARTTKYVFSGSVSVDLAPDGDQALHLQLDHINSSAAIRQLSSSWYDAEDVDTISSVQYEVLTRDAAGNVLVPTTGNWAVVASLAPTATGDTGVQSTSSLASGSSGFLTATAGTAPRFAFVQMFPEVNLANADGAWHSWWNLVVYGSSGIPGTLAPDGTSIGVTASDTIVNICDRYCPELDSSGVETTGHAITHLAFRDRTDPYDGFLEVNKYHRWELGVFENRVLRFFPKDLTKADWIVRTDEGATLELQGDTTQDLANGIVIQFSDVKTGNTRTVTPDVDDRLKDDSDRNPVNQHGLTVWTEQSLSTPCSYEDAVAVGSALLSEFNQPKAPGTIGVPPFVYDRFGNRQPSWKMRCSETVSVEDFPNDRPRLISETSYSDDSRGQSLAVEGGTLRVEAWLDRLATAAQANNLVAP